MSAEAPNVITPRELAVVKIRHLRAEAGGDASRVVYGSPVWVFLMRLGELLDEAADTLAAVVEPPES